MVLNDVSRKQAFLTHLAASGTVFIVLSYYIVFHWYPDFYFSLDGGSRAIGTIFFVDIVLGLHKHGVGNTDGIDVFLKVRW